MVENDYHEESNCKWTKTKNIATIAKDWVFINSLPTITTIEECIFDFKVTLKLLLSYFVEHKIPFLQCTFWSSNLSWYKNRKKKLTFFM